MLKLINRGLFRSIQFSSISLIASIRTQNLEAMMIYRVNTIQNNAIRCENHRRAKVPNRRAIIPRMSSHQTNAKAIRNRRKVVRLVASARPAPV